MDSKIFQGEIDGYNGVTVDSQKEPCDQIILINKLKDSLEQWIQENRKCIWFKVNIKDAAWVPVLANEGFNFHHSRDDFVMMYKWLPKDRQCNLPPACHTNLGVGGMVFNDKNQLLVVTEMHTKFTHWKLPGGYVERSEDIVDAAIREVKEETGIDATFISMVTLQHSHNRMFNNSDIYVVVMLKATSDIITKSDIEIEACKWMDIDEFLNHPSVNEINRFTVKKALDLQKRKLKLDLRRTTVKVQSWSRQITALVLDDL